MKPLLCFGAIFLLSLPCRAQQSHVKGNVHGRPTTAPECPEGKACTTFKQIWEGGDRTVKNASWACFDSPRELPFGGHAPTYDNFFLLRDGVSAFDFRLFNNGIENVSATAAAESFRNGVAHWKPDSISASLDVVKSEDDLTLNLHYTSTTESSVGFHFEMRLSSGRYASK